MKVSIANRQSLLEVDRTLLRRAAEIVFGGEGISKAAVTIALVDDPTIHELNQRFLKHDYPTDVLSFTYQQSASRVEGEIVVSTDTAKSTAAELGWPAEHELMLYVVHGLLHLVGYDDTTPAAAKEMRRREREVFAELLLPSVPDRDAMSTDSPPPG